MNAVAAPVETLTIDSLPAGPDEAAEREALRRDVLAALREADANPDRIATIPIFRELLRRYGTGAGLSREGFIQQCRILAIINPGVARRRQVDRGPVPPPYGWYR